MAQRRIEEQEMTQRLEEIRAAGEVEVGGETSINDDVLASIAGIAARQVQGVSALGTSSIRRTLAERLGGAEQRSRGVEVEAGKKEALVDLTIRAVYGYSIPNIVIEIRKKVADALLRFTGLIAKEINIEVAGIDFPEKMQGRVE